MHCIYVRYRDKTINTVFVILSAQKQAKFHRNGNIIKLLCLCHLLPNSGIIMTYKKVNSASNAAGEMKIGLIDGSLFQSPSAQWACQRLYLYDLHLTTAQILHASSHKQGSGIDVNCEKLNNLKQSECPCCR